MPVQITEAERRRGANISRVALQSALLAAVDVDKAEDLVAVTATICAMLASIVCNPDRCNDEELTERTLATLDTIHQRARAVAMTPSANNLMRATYTAVQVSRKKDHTHEGRKQ